MHFCKLYKCVCVSKKTLHEQITFKKISRITSKKATWWILRRFSSAGPPQFLKNSTTITNLDPSGSLTLEVKSHTAAVNGCLLTPLSSEDKDTREVNCTLQGTKPNLLLNLHFQNESLANGNWILTLRSESGSANTTLRIIKSQNETGKQRSYIYKTWYNYRFVINIDMYIYIYTLHTQHICYTRTTNIFLYIWTLFSIAI